MIVGFHGMGKTFRALRGGFSVDSICGMLYSDYRWFEGNRDPGKE
jgi:hypothetical protein